MKIGEIKEIGNREVQVPASRPAQTPVPQPVREKQKAFLQSLLQPVRETVK